ncbi:hypothetical protein N7474_006974 [Penicillium riverlandense]|uniref:uncharacterized protein n=1 Tax=Penicillium riverlandense TaxID=1903569 RepID=UPI0025468DDD|nr:uncharacterized protein N7474_006974 [Penicillium riverlandense]KAJ5815197.1 hypothetical protein N7474_006974 [Penicillium riverlandense]
MRCHNKGRNCVYESEKSHPGPINDEARSALDPPAALVFQGAAEVPLMNQQPSENNVSELDLHGSFDIPDNTVGFSGNVGESFAAFEMGLELPWLFPHDDPFYDSPLVNLQPHFDPTSYYGYLHASSITPPGATRGTTQNYRQGGSNLQRGREDQSEMISPSPRGQQQLGRSQGATPSVHSIISPTDDDITMAESFCHVRMPLETAYNAILAFYKEQSKGRSNNLLFPQLSVFDSFIQLYYEYFDNQLPFIHPSLLEQEDIPWILILAVASVGSQYTKLTKRAQYSSMLTLLRLSLPLDALKAQRYDTLILAQCVLLAVTNLMFTGFDNVINLQIYRSWLATLIRPFLSHNTSKASLLSPEVTTAKTHGRWHSWPAEVVDCMCFIFMGMQPSFAAQDYEQLLPSSDAMWKLRNKAEWSNNPGSCNGLSRRPQVFLIAELTNIDFTRVTQFEAVVFYEMGSKQYFLKFSRVQ